ncbi:DUF1465 family protein [Pseudemcibacter aquimaris]|uniref:DUF1465 family protein n=1 Tax=Pseudemcibacter aquimaris TaxID=2857064 RepID=UPI00201324A6|nr:DUF1465 family protein [Pseudemcibacter aquimaris]MCC3860045.1 DUF1465 family protein [Pseudemcibacter aquimaris]WDU57375.1 DUF1465 family protein [Pseudemcibacter aquimaris]
MLEDAIDNDGQLKAEILEELYQEALELSSSIVEYLQSNKKTSLKTIGADLMGYYTLECNRMTTGVMQAMSWCLMQKGVRGGELSVSDAAEKKNRLSDNHMFDVPIGCDTDKFPPQFIEYSLRVRDLYAKIVRIDRVLYDGGVVEENPVHNLIDEIERKS